MSSTAHIHAAVSAVRKRGHDVVRPPPNHLLPETDTDLTALVSLRPRSCQPKIDFTQHALDNGKVVDTTERCAQSL